MFKVSNRRLDIQIVVLRFICQLAKVSRGQSQDITASQVAIVGLGIYWTDARQAGTLLRCQLDLDFIRNGACNLILQARDIARTTIVRAGPELALGRNAFQADGDSHSIT